MKGVQCYELFGGMALNKSRIVLPTTVGGQINLKFVWIPVASLNLAAVR